MKKNYVLWMMMCPYSIYAAQLQELPEESTTPRFETHFSEVIERELSAEQERRYQQKEINTLVFKTKKHPRIENHTDRELNVSLAHILPVPDYDGICIINLAERFYGGEVTSIAHDGFPKVTKKEKTLMLRPNTSRECWIFQDKTISPHSHYEFQGHLDAFCQRIYTDHDGYYRVVAYQRHHKNNTVTESYKIQMTSTYDRGFPSQLVDYDFSLIAEKYGQSTPMMKQYWQDRLVSGTQTHMMDNFLVLANTAFQEGRLLLDTCPQNVYKIPLKIHTAWRGNMSENAQWIINTRRTITQSRPNVEHIIWIDTHNVAYKKSCIQKLATELNRPISLMIINDCFPLDNLLPYRILAQEGGVYRHANVEFLHDLSHFNRCFEFYCGIDMASFYLPCPDVIAAYPQHPVLMYAIHEAARLCEPVRDRLYMPGLLLVKALLRTVAQHSSHQMMIFPPHIFTPKIKHPSHTQKLPFYLDTMGINHSNDYHASKLK